MLFATFDVDLPDDPLFIALEAAGEPWPWWWMRIVQAAKRHNRRGRVCQADGRPFTARDLALVHHRNIQRAEEWGQMLETCMGLGLLVQDDDGAYRIADWKRWHRSPSDDPEETRTRKALQRDRQRSHDLSRGVTTCHEVSRAVTRVTTQSRAEQSRDRDRAEQQQSMRAHAREGLAAAAGSDDYIGSGNGPCHEVSRAVTRVTTQSRAEQSRDRDRAEQQQSMRAHAREGLAAAAAADVAVAPEDDLGPESESLYTGRPGRTSLDELRPAIAQAMQALGILGSPSGTWWTSVTAWAAPAIASGATLDDVRDAIHFAAAKAAHDRPRRPWPYAMTIASEEIGQIARRNQMRRDWEANGRRGPEPLPYVWTPEDDTCSR